MANRILTPVTELDFDGIKQNLKNYLSTTNEFSDYDYEGAGINILLDLLAYNTHYTAMYANMLAAESFLDSAILRKSVVSLAKNLGYVPDSKNAATATVNLTFGDTAGVPSTVPAGTVFTAFNGATEYRFTTIDSFDIDKTTVPYKVNNIVIHQGEYKSFSFVYDPDSNTTKVELPVENIDKDMVKVYVMNSIADLGNADISWRKNTDFLELTPTSKVYFLTENFRGKYEVSFGDGILGATPEKGNYIVVLYFETAGFLANGIGKADTATSVSSFNFDGIGGNKFNSTVSTVSPSQGGSERENEAKIKYTAPKYYQSQDRTVTETDYESIILREYPAAESVRVWGGEDNDPPEYGKVFISIMPKNAAILSDAQKQSIIDNVLRKKKIVSINAQIVDVDYTNVLVECFATYDSTRSFTSESLIRDAIRAGIYLYADNSLMMFGSPFRYSSLSAIIDRSNGSMVSNRLNTKLMKKVIPTFGLPNYTLDYGAQLYHPYDGFESIVTTSVFKHRDSQNVVRDCYIKDNGSGRLQMFTTINNNEVVVKSNIGSIDYINGKINLIGFAPTGTGKDPFIKFIVVPDQRFDIIPRRNQVLRIEGSLPESITINLQDSGVRKV